MTVKIIRLDECESTHKHIRENIASLQAWTVVTAEYQSGGRGRHGRAWIAPKGKNLCFNILLPAENLKPEFYAPVAQIAAMTIANILPIQATVKWPNDVLANKCKICGIISELIAGSHAGLPLQFPYISLGIGLNVNTEKSDFAGLDRPATSMFIETEKIWDREAVLQEFLGEFERNFLLLCKNGLLPFIEEWRKMGCFVGHKARVVNNNSVLEGEIEAVQDDGSLLFRTDNGLQTVWSGDLEI
jgi:BirA family biotin operon repressor/biotin-[acetyl-CoA-carboxylase] ligase